MSWCLNLSSAVFAFLAAAFWLKSAWGKLPPMRTYWDQAPADDPLFQALAYSARMNRRAAGAAGISAALTGIAQLLTA
jgi:hypothetical protein